MLRYPFGITLKPGVFFDHPFTFQPIPAFSSNMRSDLLCARATYKRQPDFVVAQKKWFGWLAVLGVSNKIRPEVEFNPVFN